MRAIALLLCLTSIAAAGISWLSTEPAVAAGAKPWAAPKPPAEKSPAEKPTPEKERSVADIAAAIKPSLVKVIQEGRQGVEGLGSGFVLREDGLIATNRHVIGEARRIKVETSDGKVEEVTEVFASDVRLDLAIDPDMQRPGSKAVFRASACCFRVSL